MYRKAALLLFALVCVAPLAFAAEDEELLDAPLFKGEELISEPQRALLAYPSKPPTYPPTKVCNPGKDYEVYFVAHPGVKNKKGIYRWGLLRDRLWAPALKAVAKNKGLPWKFPVTNYSRAVFQKTKPFLPKSTLSYLKKKGVYVRFYGRIVVNLTDVPCKRRHNIRSAFRKAARIGAASFTAL